LSQFESQFEENLYQLRREKLAQIAAIGEKLGGIGSTGRSTGPHLHYEVRIHDTPVNPSKYLHAAPARQLASTPSVPTPTNVNSGGAD